jgi:hypothetical protein
MLSYQIHDLWTAKQIVVLLNTKMLLYQASTGCTGSASPAVDDLELFLSNLHGIVVEIAIPLAGVIYA